VEHQSEDSQYFENEISILEKMKPTQIVPPEEECASPSKKKKRKLTLEEAKSLNLTSTIFSLN